jgi:hypothetical protein
MGGLLELSLPCLCHLPLLDVCSALGHSARFFIFSSRYCFGEKGNGHQYVEATSACCQILFKLYQIEESMEMNSRTTVAKNEDLAGLREEQRVHNEALDAARAESPIHRNAGREGGQEGGEGSGWQGMFFVFALELQIYLFIVPLFLLDRDLIWLQRRHRLPIRHVRLIMRSR